MQRQQAGGPRKGSYAPIELNAFATAFNRARAKAGIEDLRIHDLRHSAASRITRVAGIKAAQKALGHKRITTTERYAHLSQEDLRAALNAAAPASPKVPQLVPRHKSGGDLND